MIDFSAIAARALGIAPQLLTSWIPGGHVKGKKYLACCPFHDEKTPSFDVNLETGLWSCLGCGKGGRDMIALFSDLKGIKNGEGAKMLAEDMGVVVDRDELPPPTVSPAKSKKQKWVQVVPAPEHAPEPSMRHYSHGEPVRKWRYTDAEGKTIGWVARYNRHENGAPLLHEDGTPKKSVEPMTWGRNLETGEEKWCWLSFPKPRPLYGLALLAEKPEARVVVVEGEKCADALRERGLLVISWPGGGQAVKHADWTPLKGRKVTFWPDKDRKKYTETETKDPAKVGTEKPWHEQSGYKCMAEVSRILTELGCEVRQINPPADVADGWDCADAIAEGWTNDQIGTLFRTATIYTAEPALELPKQPDKPKVEGLHAHPKDWPFKVLGHNHGSYYYMSHASGQIVELSPRGHNKNDLLQLAPLAWWAGMYPGEGEDTSVSWLWAADSLMQESMQTIFDPYNIRGRGAWIDAGRALYHAGETIHMEGQAIPLKTHESKFIYQRSTALDIEDVEPASDTHARMLITILKQFHFRDPLDHLLVAGWLASAPICGALEWRPHLWVSGKSGSGKTSLIDKVVTPMLGTAAVFAQGTATSEAGLRQTIRHDAFPIVIDEAETETKLQEAEFQKILMLARQASRESRARIYKGTSGGSAQSFSVRSMFMFASIGVAATQRADLSRITVVEMIGKAEDEAKRQHWTQLLAILADTCENPLWTAAIRARSVKYAQVISKNAHIFARAAAPFVGATRDGDQVGALLAGAFSLISTKEVTAEYAEKWCSEQDWTTRRANDTDMDEHRCLSHLLGAIIDHEEDGYRCRRNIGELIGMALSVKSRDIERAAANQTLLRHGIGIRKDLGVDISNSHQELRKIFSDTPFSGKWSDQLRRAPGAAVIGKSRFNAAAHRAVRLPFDAFEAGGTD